MNQENSEETFKNLDRTGIVASGVCLIHCLFIPVIASLSPSISTYLQNEWVHRILLVLLIPIAFFSLNKSRKVHGNIVPSIFGAMGVLLLFVGVGIEIAHIEIPYLEKIVTSSGSFALVIGHFLNMISFKKSCQRC